MVVAAGERQTRPSEVQGMNRVKVEFCAGRSMLREFSPPQRRIPRNAIMFAVQFSAQQTESS